MAVAVRDSWKECKVGVRRVMLAEACTEAAEAGAEEADDQRWSLARFKVLAHLVSSVGVLLGSADVPGCREAWFAADKKLLICVSEGFSRAGQSTSFLLMPAVHRKPRTSLGSSPVPLRDVRSQRGESREMGEASRARGL